MRLAVWVIMSSSGLVGKRNYLCSDDEDGQKYLVGKRNYFCSDDKDGKKNLAMVGHVTAGVHMEPVGAGG